MKTIAVLVALFAMPNVATMGQVRKGGVDYGNPAQPLQSANVQPKKQPPAAQKTLEAENEQLRQQIRQLLDRSAPSHQYQLAIVQKLVDENYQLKTRLGEAKAVDDTDPDKRAAALNARQIERDAAKSSAVEEMKGVEELRARVAELETQSATLQKDLQLSRAEEAHSQQRITDLISDKVALTKKFETMAPREPAYIIPEPAKPHAIDPANLKIGAEGTAKDLKIVQIIDANTMLVHLDEFVIMVHGVSTAGKVDGQAVTDATLLRATGTQQYATPSGSTRTVFLFEPIKK